MCLNKRGQFIPITAMVMFTTVIFMVAVLNIYKVTRAKLKVQNLADAAALNIASQIASSMNKTADMNEWMNHMLDQGGPSGPTKPGDLPDCVNAAPDLPPLACAENTQKSSQLFMFSSYGNAAAYAGLIQRINQTQDMFINSYNNFIGAGQLSNASAMSNSSLQSVLLSDIKQLTDSGTQVVVWNTLGGQMRADQKAVLARASSGPTLTHSLDTSGMQGIKYKTHDVMVGYWGDRTFLGITAHKTDTYFRTLGDILMNGDQKNPAVVPEANQIGWKELDTGPDAPQITLNSTLSKVRYGAGAMVIRTVQVPVIGNVAVVGKAQAYVVEGSGAMGAQTDMVTDPFTGAQRPVFKPTYWVKLAGVQ
jgi:hypothetical protein